MQLVRERSERKEEIACLKSEISTKVSGMSALVSKAFSAEAIASQKEAARSLMKVTRGLDRVERGLDDERRTRTEEIANLTSTVTETMTLAKNLGETVTSATEKIREELSELHRVVGNTSTTDETSVREPPKSDLSAEYYVKVRQTQDHMAEVIASLTRRLDLEDQLPDAIASLSQRIDSAPWTKSIEQVDQSIQDLAADAEKLTIQVAQVSAEFETSQSWVEDSLSGLSNFRQEIQMEFADLRTASQGHRFATEAFQSQVLRDIQTKNDATATSQLDNRLKDIETKSDTTALQLNRLDGVVCQVLEHMTKLERLTPRVDAAETKISAELTISPGQVEAPLPGLSSLTQEIEKELADLRMTSPRSREFREVPEDFQSAVERDIETISDVTASPSPLDNRRKDMLAKSDSGLSNMRQEMRGALAELRVASQGQVLDMRQEMQKELADLRMASQEHMETFEAFKVAVLSDIETCMKFSSRILTLKEGSAPPTRSSTPKRVWCGVSTGD
jgi:prefoldin subunit 5